MKKKLLLFLLSCSLIFVSYYLIQTTRASNFCINPKPLTWHKTQDRSVVESILLHDNIINKIPMQEYLKKVGKIFESDNEVFLITFKNGVQAVFKPGEMRFAEVAAYKADSFIGNNFVPPTVLRTIDNKEGSLQFFVQSDIDLLQEIKNDPLFLINNISKNQRDAMKLFYFVFGQWDINYSNQIITKNKNNYTLALIDNAAMYTMQQIHYGDYAFVRRGYSDKRNDSFDAPFPFEQAVTLTNPSFETMQQCFAEFLEPEDLLFMYKRYTKLSITYCIWRNALWIQYYHNHPTLLPNYVEDCSMVQLEKYQHLTPEILERFWKEALENNKEHTKRLIALTLERRDQLSTLYAFN